MGVRGRRRRGLRIGPRPFWFAVLAVLLVGLVKLYGPLATSRAQQNELARLRLQKASLLAEQQRLQAYKRHLASDAGLERAARREGYVRDGERRLVFVREKSKEPEPAAQASETEQKP